VHRGAGAYICGEETALLDSLEGKRATRASSRRSPPTRPLPGPDLINNVETARDGPSIIELGGQKYAELGVQGSTGTKLVSVSGNVRNPGNFEIELGTSSRELIYGLPAGRPRGARSSSGPRRLGSPVLTKDDLDLAYDFDTMAKAARCSAPARSSWSTIELRRRRRAEDREVLRHESCGKCTPCREGRTGR